MTDTRSAGKSTKSSAASNSRKTSTSKRSGASLLKSATVDMLVKAPPKKTRKKAEAKAAPVKTTELKTKPVKAAPAKTAAAKPAKKKKAPLFAVRDSGIHGKGAFAVRAIRKGRTIAEYTGERISWEEAERRYPVDPIPYHTFLFEIGDGSFCLDAQNRPTPSKWINHSCKPNCEAQEDEDERVFIIARRAIAAGEELTYDYNLTCEERMSLKERKRRYPCWCGAKNCRETMLGKKP